MPPGPLASLLLRTGLVLALLAAGLHADEVPLPGFRPAPKKVPAEGSPFAPKGWSVEGEVTWTAAPPLRAPGLGLAPGARVARTIDIPELEPWKATQGPVDPADWVALLVVDADAAAEGAGLELAIETTRGESKVQANRLAPVARTTGRIVMELPGLERGGALELRIAARGAVTIRDLAILRLPRNPAEIRFAKSNGQNGPDRLESGALGFVAQTIDGVGPLPVLSVREGSPAAAAGLVAGDLILSVDGEPLPRSSCRPGWAWFEDGHEARLGRAVERALATEQPRVRLGIWREDRVLECVPVARPALPENFPFDDTATPRLYEELLAWVRAHRGKNGAWANGGNDWIQTAFAGLALLGRRDPQDRDTIVEIAEWYLAKFPDPEDFGNLGYWAASYSGIFLSEYLLATGDERVRPFLERALRWVEEGFHTSKWGTPCLGHGPSGLPYENKALMAPASHLIVFEALARKAGIESRIWTTLLPYMESAWSDPEKKGGHGGMGYNASYRDQEEFWSRTGLFAMASELRSEKPAMRRAMIGIMRRRHPWMRNSHAYGNPGDAWGLAGLARCDREAFAEVMKAWRWNLGGAWEPGFGLRHTTAHMGSPYMGEEGLVNPAYAMVLSARHRGLFITGAPDSDRGWMKLATLRPRVSALRFERGSDGKVGIRAAIPGAPIRYTTDGSEPDARSKRYSGPVPFSKGGEFRARVCLDDGTLGPERRERFGPAKTRWAIVAADGAKDEAEARHRASFLIDDSDRPWQPDRGQDAADLPLSVTIDLGEVTSFSGLAFRGPNVPDRLRIAWARQADALPAESREVVIEKESDPRALLGETVRARFLRVEFVSLFQKDRLRIVELDLF
ncbi:MAG: DUF6288 domain-containing protein [Planctomycetota bacterium]